MNIHTSVKNSTSEVCREASAGVALQRTERFRKNGFPRNALKSALPLFHRSFLPVFLHPFCLLFARDTNQKTGEKFEKLQEKCYN